MTRKEFYKLKEGDWLYDKVFIEKNPNHYLIVDKVYNRSYEIAKIIEVNSSEKIKQLENRDKFTYNSKFDQHLKDLEFYIDPIYLKNIYKNFTKEQITVLKKSIEF